MRPLSLDIRLAYPGFTLKVAQDLPLAGVTALFGRSGSGKTTLLRVIAGLEPGARGRVALGDAIWQGPGAPFVAPHRRGAGFVFQDGRLFPHLSVAGNLRYAAKRARGGPDLDEVASALDLVPLLARSPGSLSGGEKQRVAIGRSLLSAPQLLLMDEPLASLDEDRKAEILPYLERLSGEWRIPVLYVTHSMDEVARLATYLIILREGKVALSGPAADILAEPAAAPLIGVREAGAILPARIVAHHDDGLTELAVSGGSLLLPRLPAAPGSMLRLRIHAHDVILATSLPAGLSALNVLAATVTSIHEGEGPGAAVGLLCGNDKLLARITKRSVARMGLAPGVRCFAILKSTAVARADIGTAMEARGKSSAA